MRSKKVQELIEALEPVAKENGCEIVDAQILGSNKNPILRIYLDSADGGIDLDQISKAQKMWLEPIVDNLDIISGNYTLEVSSPGIDRPLRTREHFEKFAGENVKITSDPIDGRKRFNGLLKGMQDDDVIVEIEDETYKVGKIEF